MNNQTFNCWVCGQSQGPLMPLNQGGWQAGETFYIHTMCFLFFDHGDWTYDGRNYVMRNDQIFFAQTKSCFSCSSTQKQRLVKCHDISCQNYYHIGCIFRNQMVVYENKQHNYKMARLVIFCPQHIQYGLEKEKREHITKFNFLNLDSQIIAILNDHIAQKEKYNNVIQGVTPRWSDKKKIQKSSHKERDHNEKKARKRERERKRSHSRSRSHHRKRSSHKNKSRKDKSQRKHKHHHDKERRSHSRNSSLKFSDDEEQILTFSSSEQQTKKHKNLDDEFFNKIVGDDNPEHLIKQATIKQATIRDYQMQIQIKKKTNPERTKQEINQNHNKQQSQTHHQHQEQPIRQILKQQNSLEALAQQKRQSEAIKKEQDILVQKQLLENLIQQQSTFYIENIPKQQTQAQKTTFQRKQRLLPMNQKDIFDMIEVLHGYIPLYPQNVNESKRDIHIAAWWECVSMLFFQEVDTINLNLINPTSVSEQKLWYESTTDQDLFQLSQQRECYEPMIFTNFSQQDTVNVLYQLQQNRSLFRYQFDQIDDKKYDRQLSIPSVNIQSSQGPIKQDKQEKASKYKDHYGQELTFIESLPLTQEEFQECLLMDDTIKEARKQIEAIQDDEYQIGELDICHNVLNNQLKQQVYLNNSLKAAIVVQTQKPSHDISQKIKEQNLLMDYLRWQQVLKSMKSGYADKTTDILSCFYRLPVQATTAHKEKQKGLIKMQSILSKRNNKPLDTDCKICFDNETCEINPVIYCDKCQTSFHRLCYGILGVILDHQDFLCDGCRTIDKNQRSQKLLDVKQSLFKSPNKVACQICGKLGLPQKLLKNKFYHVACLILTNSIIYENGQLAFRGGVNTTNIQNMVDENESTLNQCAICGKFKGFKLQCNNTQGIPCRHSFHPMCAYLNGIKMQVQPGEFREGVFTKVTVKITCALHIEENFNNQILQVYYRRFGLNLDQTAKLGGFDQFKDYYKNQLGYTYLQTKIPNRKLKMNPNLHIRNNQPQEGSFYEYENVKLLFQNFILSTLENAEQQRMRTITNQEAQLKYLNMNNLYQQQTKQVTFTQTIFNTPRIGLLNLKKKSLHILLIQLKLISTPIRVAQTRGV